jgi:CheY-like chemotaxis protein
VTRRVYHATAFHDRSNDMTGRKDSAARTHDTSHGMHAPEAGVRESRTVLVANSNLNNQRTIADLLAGQGYRVVMASNGKQALCLIEQGGIDLVVSAMTMNGMDGLELLRAMRDARLAPPVVAVSSGKDVIDEVYLRGASLYGAAKTHSWPLTPSIFLGDLEEILHLASR